MHVLHAVFAPLSVEPIRYTLILTWQLPHQADVVQKKRASAKIDINTYCVYEVRGKGFYVNSTSFITRCIRAKSCQSRPLSAHSLPGAVRAGISVLTHSQADTCIHLQRQPQGPLALTTANS